MDDSIKEQLVARFRLWLDRAGVPDPDEAENDFAEDEESSDLYSLFVELAGLRTEVRTESRLIKDALDQFRAVFNRLEAEHTRLEREAAQARSELKELARTLLRPLLLDLLDLRDRLEASLREPQQPSRRRFWTFALARRPIPEPDDWRAGQLMTLRRLDRMLADRGVVPLDVAGRLFDPRSARAVLTVNDPSRNSGMVIEVVRAGFSWNGEGLRPADVIVNKRDAVPDGAHEGTDL